MKLKKSQEYILGYAASATDVAAVLLHNTADGPELVRTFHRSRTSGHFSGADIDSPGLNDDSGTDFSFTLTDGESRDNSLFLASEFSVDDAGEATDVGGADFTVPAHGATPFDLEALEIMAECEAAGYGNVRVAFALGSEHTHTVQVDVPDDNGAPTGRKKRKAVDRSGNPSKDLLLELLRKTQHGRMAGDRTAFLPMVATPGSEQSRLAVFAQSFEPVTPTLRAIRDRKRRFPNVLLVDSEVTLLSGLVGASNSGDDSEASKLIVRVGSDDTIVVFMIGNELLHVENLRSVTVFDPAETICSRVLLLQDELGRGDVDCIWLFSDEREDTLEESFEEFFPETQVARVRTLLPVLREQISRPLDRETLLAATAALRTVPQEPYKSAFHPVNFLDSKLAGPQFQLPFSWPVAAMIVVLFGSTLFFVSTWFEQQTAIISYRSQLGSYPASVIEADLDQLEHRIDSLQSRSVGLTKALDVLDSLLVGSDRWSRTMERLSTATSRVSDIWIEDWSEDSGDERLDLSGTAVSRDAVVALATELDGIIESVEFSSVRDWPVYEWEMSIRLEQKLAEAAELLRQKVREEAATSGSHTRKENGLISGMPTVDTMTNGS